MIDNLNNERWTKEQDDYILANKTKVDLAQLGRTKAALARRYEHLELVREDWSAEQDRQVLAGGNVEGKTTKAANLRRLYLTGKFYDIWDADTVKRLKQLYMAGKKNWEISKELGIPEEAIKKRLTTETRETKMEIRKFLEDQGFFVGRIISVKMMNEYFYNREALVRRFTGG